MKRKLLFMMLCIVGVLSMSAQFTSGEKYYLQNISTGKYWGAGDDNNWGTRAMLVDHPQYVTLISNDDGTYKMESQVTNGGTAYYFNGDYMDNGSPVSLKFTASGNYFTIANGNTYYGAGGSSYAISENTVDATSNSALWKVYTEDEMLATLDDADVDNPVDATFLFLDPGFGRNNRNFNAWNPVAGNLNIGRQGTDKNNNYGCGESWHSNFSLVQTQTVPNGTYKIESRAFYRQDGSDNDHLPVISVNDESVTFPLRTGAENSMQAAQQAFQAGSYAIKPIYISVTDGSMTLSLTLENNTTLWCIWDGFDITYYGDASIAEVALSEYVNAYQQALTAAQSYLNTAMFDDDKDALTEAVNDNTLNLNDPSLTKEQMEAATANLNAAAAAAKVDAAQYAYYNNVSNAIAGQTNVDLTSVTPDQNWGFETGNLTSWTSADGGGVANNNNFSGKVGSYFVERWRNGAALGSGSLTHDALVLPAGVYTISVNAQNLEQYNNNAAGKGYFLYANNDKVEIGAAGTYTILTNLADRSELVIKMALEDCTGNWVSCDDFKITYVGEDFPAYTLVTGKMNNDVAAAQTAAEAAFVANKTTENYNVLLSAIAAAQASHDAYARLAESLTVANNTLAATNVYTADAFDSFSPILEEAQTGYDQGTITTDNANAMADQIIGKGWHASYKLSDLLISAWDAQNDWTTYYINSWSVEGDGEGTSGMTTPFIEYYTSPDQKLANRTLTATLPNVENGLYEVLAFIRLVNSKTGEGNTGYDGVSLAVNDGKATAFADATQYPDGYAKVIRAEGLVKDGILVIKVDVKDTNVSWLAMKDVKYTKLRDLTEEEMAVAPTSIVLDPTNVTLTSETNTATLTPTFEPENASKNVTWTSSDESVATVADGVVTGVAPGTATITVTSSIDETVSASATVTVAYTETIVPAITYVNDGPKRTYNVTGENLIENGAFEYPNAFYNWTSANNFSDQITSANFSVNEENGNHYIVGTKNTGATGAGSLGVAWPIEAGKTYTFSYKVKSLSNAAGNQQYLKTSLTNTKGTETEVLGMPTLEAGKWTTETYTFTNDKEYQYLQIDFRWLNGQFGFDDFYLCEATATEVGNVDYITENVPTSNIGDGVFQYNQDNIDAATGLTQATPVNQYTGATVSEVQAAYDRMMTLNPPARNSRYALVVATPNHAKAGNAVVAKAGNPSNNNPTGYGFNASAEPNVNLAQAWAFKAVEGKLNTYNLYYTNENDENVYLTYGALNGSAASWKDTQIQATTVVDNAGEFQIVATSRNNVVNIMNTITNSTIACQDGGNIYTEPNNADFTVQLMEPALVEVAIAEGAYATRTFPFKPEISDVTFYKVEGMNGKTIVMSVVEEPQANTPYILYSSEEVGEDLEGYGTATSLEPIEKGLLVGTLAAENTVPAGNYVLQTLANGQKFYKVATDITNYPAYRAYLKGTSENEGVKEIGFTFDDTPTGINTINEGAFDFSNIEGVYNLSGAKIGKLQKGTNVVRMKDGSVRKVLVK